ncbi:ribonuclease D [Streptomyces spiralis]|uniref:ribonuclease D n=1 Tax=Streptomyces spiralis TaxID=66376 RepID=UPI0036861A71
MTWRACSVSVPNSTREAPVFEPVRVLRHDLTLDVYHRLTESGRVAWDIETNGLDPTQAQIGTCQIHSPPVGTFIVIGVAGRVPPLLARLLSNARVEKVFHHAPFDLSFMSHAWGVEPRNVACTKIAAKILSPGEVAEKYSLKYLMACHFGLVLDKKVRFTDWMADSLSEEQVEYAVGDVIRLLDLYDLLTAKLREQGLEELYGECRGFLPTHVRLRLRGCPDPFKY